MSLSIVQVANDLLSKLGIEGSDPTLAPALAQQDVIVAINGAGQMLQTAGEDFFTRVKTIITVAAGTQMYALPQGVQTIIGPVRLNDTTPLKALSSRGELDQFDRIFLGSTTYGAAAGTPAAYWVENLYGGETAGDISQVNIWLAPTPNAPGTMAFEGVDTAFTFTVGEIGASTLIPVAHNYAESIFLPIARMLIMRSYLFSRVELAAQLDKDAQVAMQRLGLAGGFPNAFQPTQPPREVTA